MRKYKVGDKVVTNRFKNGNGTSFVTEMEKYVGKEGEIDRISANGNYYVHGYSWRECGLKDAKETPTFKQGDRVTTWAFKSKPGILSFNDEEMTQLVGSVGIITGISSSGNFKVHGYFWPSEALTSATVDKFKKGDYIVSLYTEKPDRDFPSDHVYKQRADADYLSVEKDVKGAQNGWSLISAGSSRWRKATPLEVEAYDYANTPCNVKHPQELFGIKVGDHLTEVVLNEWRGVGTNYHGGSAWQLSPGKTFHGDRQVKSICQVDGHWAITVSGTTNVHLKLKGLKHFIDTYIAPEPAMAMPVASKSKSIPMTRDITMRDRSLVGLKIPNKELNEWGSMLGNTTYLQDWDDVKRKSGFIGDRNIVAVDTYKGKVAFRVSETANVWLAMDGFYEFALAKGLLPEKYTGDFMVGQLISPRQVTMWTNDGTCKVFAEGHGWITSKIDFKTNVEILQIKKLSGKWAGRVAKEYPYLWIQLDGFSDFLKKQCITAEAVAAAIAIPMGKGILEQITSPRRSAVQTQQSVGRTTRRPAHSLHREVPDTPFERKLQIRIPNKNK